LMIMLAIQLKGLLCFL